MRRGVHIAISLMAVLLLMRPFDCFSSGQLTQKAADCCKKGKCIPSSSSDDCCKGTLPGGQQLVISKAPDYSIATVDLITTDVLVPLTAAFATAAFTHVPVPLGSPPPSRLNLPLLI
jgi:predicted NAD/FAD-dependent oxidoreductase